ncbi:MAG: hypothetical protein V1944_01350, partial [Candidatus Aenigmatarchaeota archaeon]
FIKKIEKSQIEIDRKIEELKLDTPKSSIPFFKLQKLDLSENNYTIYNANFSANNSAWFFENVNVDKNSILGVRYEGSYADFPAMNECDDCECACTDLRIAIFIMQNGSSEKIFEDVVYSSYTKKTLLLDISRFENQKVNITLTKYTSDCAAFCRYDVDVKQFFLGKINFSISGEIEKRLKELGYINR